MIQCITIEEAAQRLSVSDNTIRRLIEEQKITAYKIRRTVRVSVQSINDYLENASINAID